MKIKQRGLVQVPIIIGLMIVAVAIPVVKGIMNKEKRVSPVVTEPAIGEKEEEKKEGEVRLEPTVFSLKQGEKKKIKLVIDTSSSGRKVDIARVGLCWDQGLKIADFDKDIILDMAYFSDFVSKKPVKLQGKDCADIIVAAQWKTADLKSGKLVAAEINFLGTDKTDGKFTIDQSLTEVSGPANQAGVYKISLGNTDQFRYQVN